MTKLFFIILSVICHEFGHIFTMFVTGMAINSVKISPFGIDIRRKNELMSYPKEILVSASGPFVNIIFFFLLVTSYPFFAYSNLLYGTMNLLPISGLDGGFVAESLLLFFFSPDRVAEILKVSSLICCIILWGSGIYIMLLLNGNMSVFVLSVFLFIGAVK